MENLTTFHSDLHNIIMVPTQERSHVVYNDISKGLFFGGLAVLAEKRMGVCINQHLYISSEDEILSGDWYLNEDNILYKALDNLPNEMYKGCKKVIATTDLHTDLPRIPKEFLKEYCKNQGYTQSLIVKSDDGKIIIDEFGDISISKPITV